MIIRGFYEKIKSKGHETVYTDLFGSEQYNLTPQELEGEINAGKKYLYTEYDKCEGCITSHHAMQKALKNPLVFKWLFKQKRK